MLVKRTVLAKRLLVPVVLVAALAMSGPAAAQSLDEIAEELADDSVYVERGAEGSETRLARVLADARDQGVIVHVVSLESSANSESVARTLSQSVGGTVIVITPDEVGATSAVYPDGPVERALDAAIGPVSASTQDGVEAFVASLVDEVGSTSGAADDRDQTPADAPDSAGETTDGGSSSGGGGGLLIFLLVVIAVVVGGWFFLRSRNRRKVKSEMEVRSQAVRSELSAIGADILALEDRVTVADDDEATTHFREGNEQYLELQNQLEKATSLWAVTQVDYGADTAAWHLDAAEALLDGEPIPEEPERPDLTTSRPPQRPPEPQRSPAQPSPRVEPRQRRRGQWNAPRTRGGGLGDILTGVLVGGVLRGGRGSTRAPGGWSGNGNLGGGGGTPSRGRTSAPRRRSGGLFGGGSGRRSRGGGSGSRRR